MGGHLAQRGLGDLRSSGCGARTTAATPRRRSFDARHGDPSGRRVLGRPVADPGPLGLFLGPIYDRGAATLHALRVKVGDDAFFAGQRGGGSRRYDDGTATTEDFEAVFEEVSGQDLTTFFDVWVRTPVKPTTW